MQKKLGVYAAASIAALLVAAMIVALGCSNSDDVLNPPAVGAGPVNLGAAANAPHQLCRAVV